MVEVVVLMVVRWRGDDSTDHGVGVVLDGLDHPPVAADGGVQSHLGPGQVVQGRDGRDEQYTEQRTG